MKEATRFQFYLMPLKQKTVTTVTTTTTKNPLFVLCTVELRFNGVFLILYTLCMHMSVLTLTCTHVHEDSGGQL